MIKYYAIYKNYYKGKHSKSIITSDFKKFNKLISHNYKTVAKSFLTKREALEYLDELEYDKYIKKRG
jgi:hypothetical protein